MYTKKLRFGVWQKSLPKDTDLCIIHRSDANVSNCQREGGKGQDQRLRRDRRIHAYREEKKEHVEAETAKENRQGVQACHGNQGR